MLSHFVQLPLWSPHYWPLSPLPLLSGTIVLPDTVVCDSFEEAVMLGGLLFDLM